MHGSFHAVGEAASAGLELKSTGPVETVYI
jgi:hypothetical protein